MPIIAIIGKEGLCTKEKNVVQDLWQQADSDFSDIADFEMKNADGSSIWKDTYVYAILESDESIGKDSKL